MVLLGCTCNALYTCRLLHWIRSILSNQIGHQSQQYNLTTPHSLRIIPHFSPKIFSCIHKRNNRELLSHCCTTVFPFSDGGAYLTGPVLSVEVADNAFAGFDGSKEVLLHNLRIFPVPEGRPPALPLGRLLELQQPPLPESLEVVQVELFQRRDLLIQLILHRLRHRQHRLLDHLWQPKKKKKKSKSSKKQSK